MLPGARGHPCPQPCKPTGLHGDLTRGPRQQVPDPPLAGDPPAGDPKEEASLPEDLRSIWAPRDVVSEPLRQAAVPHLHCPPGWAPSSPHRPQPLPRASLAQGPSKGLSVRISPVDISGPLKRELAQTLMLD